MIASARRHRLDPQAYLTGLLAQIPVLPHSKLDELLPDRWNAAMERERRETAENTTKPPGDDATPNSATV